MVLRHMTEDHVTHMLLVPTMWEMVLATRGSDETPLTDLRFALWGGMPLLSGTFARLDGWLPVPCLGSYGLTEATCVSYSTPDVYRSGRPDSSGFPIMSMEAKVVDDEYNEVPRGIFGEVLLRGSLVMTDI